MARGAVRRAALVAVHLIPQRRPDPFICNNLQVRLVASALAAVGAPNLEFFAPNAYLPSQLCEQWSNLLFPALNDLVLIHVWDGQRAHLRPSYVLLPRVSLQRGTKRGRPTVDPWATLPLLAERTQVSETPLGPLLLAFAAWLSTCGGCSVVPK